MYRLGTVAICVRDLVREGVNIAQKILTVVLIGCFIFLGVTFLSSGHRDELWRLFLAWFMLAVAYVGLFFVLKRRPK